jgi:protein-disulfide isomerase
LAKERRRRRTIIISIVAVCAVVAAGLIGLVVWESQKPGASAATPATAIDDGHGIPVSDGPVTVDLYVDLLCPVCKAYETTVGPTLTSLRNQKKVRVVYHLIAILNNSSNPPGYSTRAGSAAGCAADYGKFDEFVQAMFAKQPAEGSAGLSDDEIIQVGASVGLIDPGFAQCVRAEKYSDWMAGNTDAAAAKNIQSTPTVLVDGKVLTDHSADGLTNAVNAAS